MRDQPESAEIAFFLPSLEGGGAERSIVRLANDIVSSKVAVDLVLAKAIGPYLSEVSCGVRVIDLASRGSAAVVFDLTRYLARCRPAVVMSCLDVSNVQLVWAARLSRFGGRVVLGQRATIAPVYAQCGWLSRSMYKLAIRTAYPRADLVICNSAAAAEEVRAIPGVQSDRVLAIHNSVDIEHIDHLSKEPLQDRWFASSRAPLVLSVGSLTSVKDRATLVKAFALVRKRRDARLAIVGAAYDPAERDRIEDLIAGLGLRHDVHLAGFDSNPYKWMRRAAVLVSSSITEGCPNQVLEGLAVGVPIVATDCPGDTGVLLQFGKWGRLVAVGNPEQLAEAIMATLDDSDPPNGRIRAADFSPAKVTAAYLDALLPQTNRAAVMLHQTS